jgi:hypothetical protein
MTLLDAHCLFSLVLTTSVEADGGGGLRFRSPQVLLTTEQFHQMARLLLLAIFCLHSYHDVLLLVHPRR